MKFMKAITILSLSALCLFGTSSCQDFLDKEPQSALTADQIYTDLDRLEPTVDGLYTSFRNTKVNREGFTFYMIGTDEAQQGIKEVLTYSSQPGFDYYNGQLNSALDKISAMWQSKWPIINTASLSICGLTILEESETNDENLKKIKLLKANACFMRAMSMFELAMHWGEVPIVEITSLDQTDTDYARRPLPEVWKQIFDDFTYASENLGEGRQTGPRATKGSAIAMLGKVCMYAPEESGYRDFQKAIGYFEQMNNGLYSLEPDYGTLFDEWGTLEFNSPESVFEIDYEPNDNGRSGWQWDMGSKTLGQAGYSEECYLGGWDVIMPTVYQYSMRKDGGVWEEGDLRKNVNLRYEWTYDGITYTVPTDAADELDPHIKKWEDRRIDRFAPEYPNVFNRSYYRVGKNYPMIRFADVLLCYAECLNEVGNTAQAIDIVNNQIRRRAWGGNLPADKQWKGLSKEQFRVEIMDERMRELCFEGWRRMDLIRTGKFVELIKQRNRWARESNTIQEYHMRYPIPDSEINNNPSLTKDDQNPGY